MNQTAETTYRTIVHEGEWSAVGTDEAWVWAVTDAEYNTLAEGFAKQERWAKSAAAKAIKALTR